MFIFLMSVGRLFHNLIVDEVKDLPPSPIINLGQTKFIDPVKSNYVLKRAVRQQIFYSILILFRGTFHTRKNSVLTKSISHHVPEIFRFL